MNSRHRFFCMVRKCVECKCHTNQNFACHIMHHQEIGLTAVVDSTTLTTPLGAPSSKRYWNGAHQQFLFLAVIYPAIAIWVLFRTVLYLCQGVVRNCFVPTYIISRVEAQLTGVIHQMGVHSKEYSEDCTVSIG